MLSLLGLALSLRSLIFLGSPGILREIWIPNPIMSEPCRQLIEITLGPLRVHSPGYILIKNSCYPSYHHLIKTTLIIILFLSQSHLSLSFSLINRSYPSFIHIIRTWMKLGETGNITVLIRVIHETAKRLRDTYEERYMRARMRDERRLKQGGEDSDWIVCGKY